MSRLFSLQPRAHCPFLSLGFAMLGLFFLGSRTTVTLADLVVVQDDQAETIEVRRVGSDISLVTQNARSNFRPHLHPIVAPDGNGVLTESSPDHHPHQTGLYWGFTRVNGRDFFHHPGANYWRRVAATVVTPEGQSVRWQTVYDLLDETGNTIFRETQTWSMRERQRNGQAEYVLDLEWKADAHQPVTIGEYDYGGLFLRMPWRPGIEGAVVNGVRQQNERAEGQRAMWVDVGMEIDGRDDWGHIAIFDHPKNQGYPQPWRVDGQLGVGPVRARLGDWKIEQGETETIRHQFIVYTGDRDDVELTETWSRFSGVGGTWVMWGIAQQEGRNAKFLTAEQAVQQMTPQPGFKVNAFAAEPMITQPMSFCWDDAGRIWVAENRDYETRGRGFANSGDSRILILEDTDHDGVADTRKVFCEGIPFPSAIAVGFDGLWLGAPPNLLFIPDRDRDDRADMDDIEVRLTGWGIRDRHETLNSFHWGPDGWLYGCQGYATPSRVGKPVGAGTLYKHNDPFPEEIDFADEPIDINGGVWRYHPTKQRFEVVAHGFSNPWGIDYDAKGQLFITACVIPHLWHVIPGGIYHRQGGSHFNPHVYRDIRTIANHRHRSAHGGARIYLSDAFPKKYHDRIFMANIHEHAVLTDILLPKGSGFVGQHGDDFLLANNAQWIGFSMELGPQGNVYVLDWHDADICGKDVLNKETGRIFRIAPEASQAEAWADRDADVSTLTDQRLAEFQTSRSAWHARRARVVLQHRATERPIAPAAIDVLRGIFRNEKNSDYRLRAFWSLHVIGALSPEELVGTLADDDAYLRAWAVQLSCEDFTPSDEAISEFYRLAKTDPSPVVRLYLASALQRVPQDARWPLVNELVQHAEDNDDHNLPKMIWFGLEPLVASAPDQAIELASRSKLHQVTQHVARRLAHANELERLVNAIVKYPHVSLQLLRGLQDGLEGRNEIDVPTNWSQAYAKLRERDETHAKVATALAQQFGDSTAADLLLEVVKDTRRDAVERQQALRGLSRRKHAPLRQILINLIDDDELRTAAIRAIADYDDPTFGTELLKRYGQLSTADKLEAIHALAARPAYGRRLTDAIRDGEIPRRDIPAYVARQLQRVVGNGFLEVWGPIDALSADQTAAMKRLQRLLTTKSLAEANLDHGKALFKRTCHSCHKLHGEGGNVGPDITGANRSNLDYLLGNIVTPSAIIQDAYKASVVLTNDGRVYTGILVGENDRQIQLRIAGQDEPARINKSEIESREIAPVSMMPNGLLNTLTDQEIIDLIGYLQK